MTLSHKLRFLNAMKCSELWITWATLGLELKALATINNFRLWFT